MADGNSSAPVASPCNSTPEPPRSKKKPRRKHRNMFRDERGRWWIDYYTPDGRRRRKIAGKTKEDAERLLRTIRTSIDSGEYIDAKRAPGFSDFCTIFMERHGNHKRSYRRDCGRMARLKTYFGNRKLSAITPSHIEDYRIARLGEPDRRDKKTEISPEFIAEQRKVMDSPMYAAGAKAAITK
jgi:hypothetical protein